MRSVCRCQKYCVHCGEHSRAGLSQVSSEIVGKQINYVSPPQDIYVETLTGAGVPAEHVGMFAGFAEAITQGEFSAEKTDLENLLGRKPITAKAFLKELYTSK